MKIIIDGKKRERERTTKMKPYQVSDAQKFVYFEYYNIKTIAIE